MGETTTRVTDQLYRPEFAFPILSLAFTVLANLGFFRQFGVPWFSTLTLSEHTVFSMQFLPAAFLIAAFLFLALFTQPIAPETRRAKIETVARMCAIALIILTLGIYFFSWNHILGSVPYLLGLFILTLGVFGYTITGHKALFTGIWIVTAGAIAYFHGMGRANQIITDPAPMYVLRESGGWEVRGTLISVGERGILFFNSATKTIELRAASKVESIVRRLQPSS